MAGLEEVCGTSDSAVLRAAILSNAQSKISTDHDETMQMYSELHARDLNKDGQQFTGITAAENKILDASEVKFPTAESNVQTK